MTRVFPQRLLFFGIISLVVLSFWSCEENPEAIDFSDRNAQIITDTLFATLDDTQLREREGLTTLTTVNLLAGEFAGVTCRPLMRFGNLPESVTFDSAWVSLTIKGHVGSATAAPLQINVYPVSVDWLADTSAVWQDNEFNDNIDESQLLGSFSIAPTDTLSGFSFNSTGLSRLQSWADTSSGVTNNGLAFAFSGAEYVSIIEARDLNGTLGPTLYLQYRDSVNSVVTDTLVVLLDVFLNNGTVDRPADRLYTSTLNNSYISLLQFNVQSLVEKYPQGVIIESADLQLPIDRSNSFFSSGLIRVLPLDSAFSGSEYVINSDFSNAIGADVFLNVLNSDSTVLSTATANEQRELAGNYIQTMYNDPDLFKGLYLEDGSLNGVLRRMAFYRYNDPDPAKRPRLVLRLLKLQPERL